MKFTRSHLVFAAMAAVIAVLIWALIYYARDEFGASPGEREEAIPTASMADEEEGRAVVRIPPASQKASGIAVEQLRAGKSEAAAEAYGVVMNLQPLAEARGRYLAATAEAAALRAVVASAESDFKRMQALYADDRNVSEQAMRASEGRYRSEQARLLAAEQGAASARDAIRAAWGDTVARWATGGDAAVMQSLLQQSSHLVQLVLPYDLPRGAVRGRITVAPAVARENARPARFVGDSPQVDPGLPGETYFYLVEGGGLRAGMRVLARIGLGGTPVDGVIVPPAAVVWHAGKAWVYVKDEDGQTFARHEVSTSREVDGGWFNAGDLDDDDEVVVSGAQLLLSEELKYQIRNENED